MDEMRAQGYIQPDRDGWFELVGVRGSGNNANGRLAVLLKITNAALFGRFFDSLGRPQQNGQGRSLFRRFVAQALNVEVSDFQYQLHNHGDKRGRPTPASAVKNDYMFGWSVTSPQPQPQP